MSFIHHVLLDALNGTAPRSTVNALAVRVDKKVEVPYQSLHIYKEVILVRDSEAV